MFGLPPLHLKIDQNLSLPLEIFQPMRLILL